MLDINYIREYPEVVKKAITDKGGSETGLVDEVLGKDAEWRALVHRSDQLRSESNSRSKDIGILIGKGRKDEAEEVIRQTGEMKEELKEIDERLAAIAGERTALLFQIPNVPHPSVPVGRDESGNQVGKSWGTPVDHSWRKPHWELTEEHGWIDFRRGVKVSGAGFPFYLGPVAQLQRALINFFLDSATANGYTEMQAPYFVNEDSARGTGQIPDKEDMMYVIPRDEFFAIPTAEVPVTNFHRDEILGQDQLPVRYCCYTPCWRREAGSYGKDVRGLNRLHQFDKVELVKFVHPDTSYDELESLCRDAEILLESLELPYRTLLMCTGDMGFTQSKKYDLEVWSPGQKRWLEVSSCSNFESFQARRMMVRYRDEIGKPRILHTLNGSGLALPRVMSAILETYQEENGKVRIPEVLKGYLKRDYL
jgi:seryl-tRNA synthetase